MEIKRLSSQEIEMAKLNGTKINDALETASGNKNVDLQDPIVDSQSTEQFEAVKKTVANAVRPGSAALIEKLKAAVANGDLDKIDSKTLADSMLEDGFDENFFNN